MEAGAVVTKPRSEYYHVTDGEWIEVQMRNNRDQCCDCGLIHRIDYRINDKGKIEMRAYRDPRATNGARRHFNFAKDE